MAEAILPEVLRRFALEHPAVELTLRVERSDHLIDAVRAGELDAAIAVRRDDPLLVETLSEMPMIWIGPEAMSLAAEQPVPLVLFDPPCSFRSAALAALASVGRPSRMALTSPSLTGLRSAAAVGLGITVRTRLLLGQGLTDVGASLSLPSLPNVALALYAYPAGEPWPARDDFIELARRTFRSQPHAQDGATRSPA